ncbi:hypothetical protein HANVADRAFT_52609 [Hanseniaspora valbyensis NRRL Y-1626]|uniref:Uncharacterized protein n=1 Tax=Hanseniaspora valbyensis NRRL Y-1626 TaxID=766949 RepID=A0A1B7TEE2_9ASCO|nr:hypothetical protein HANVADRAFT_52609 [Hanseniaspora valbyensis NRRL Y-1626]
MSTEKDPSMNANLLKDEVFDLKKQVNLMSNIVGEISETDQLLTKQTIKLLTENIKVLVSNQQVLENKLDDTLKNQFNTDQVVNELNWKVTRLLQLSSLDLSNNMADNRKLATAKITSVNSSATKPNKTVQIDGAKVTITKSDMANSLNNTITKLPIKHNISKSKKYFHDPISNKRLLSVVSDNSTNDQDAEKNTKEVNDSTDFNSITTTNNNNTNATTASSILPSIAKVSQPIVVNDNVAHIQKPVESDKEPPLKKVKLDNSRNISNNNTSTNTNIST